MSTSEQYWIWQQLEPNDVLIRGNEKRVLLADLPPRKRFYDLPETEEQKTKSQDEYLASKGVY